MVNKIRENIDPSELIPDEQNANKGTERGQYILHESLREAGPGKAPVVDKDGRIIAGNKTVEAAQALGMKVTVVQSHGDELIVHQRMDLDLSDPTGVARRLAYMDNRSGEVSLDWDVEQMQRDHMSGVDLTEFFFASELEELGVDIETELSGSDHKKESYKPENVDPPIDDPVYEGQEYRCGNHLLRIGRSHKPGDAQVMLKAYEEYTGETCEVVDPEVFE